MKALKITALILASLIVGFHPFAYAADAAITMQEPGGAQDVPDYLRLKPKNDPLNTEAHKKREAIAGFLEAAINKRKWNQFGFSNLEINYIPGISREDSFYNPDYIKKHYPWAYPLIFPITELPNYMAISKWTKPIRISLDLPNDGKPYDVPVKNGKPVTEDPDWPNVYIDKKASPVELIFKGALLNTGEVKSKNAKAREIASIEAALLAPELAQLTGLDIAYGDETENPEPVSNVRIILVNPIDNHWMTKFKRGPVTTVGIGMGPKRATSVSMRDIVSHKSIDFTSSYGLFQVDGFFVVNSKNEIEFSVCYLQDDLEVGLLKKLVRECLIRSLGLPDLQNEFKQSYTYAWNKKDRKEGGVLLKLKALTELIGEENARPMFFNSGIFLAYQDAPKEDLITGSPELSEADKYLIQTLYSDAIKPGMNYLEAYEALMKAE